MCGNCHVVGSFEVISKSPSTRPCEMSIGMSMSFSRIAACKFLLVTRTKQSEDSIAPPRLVPWRNTRIAPPFAFGFCAATAACFTSPCVSSERRLTCAPGFGIERCIPSGSRRAAVASIVISIFFVSGWSLMTPLTPVKRRGCGSPCTLAVIFPPCNVMTSSAGLWSASTGGGFAPCGSGCTRRLLGTVSSGKPSHDRFGA
mmetsp:Transcript_13403/g.44154  ORF Transcript_13403/g.44154 Transcript_13403/m.44154 type:complete len:201 (-) Transcript_13403:1081-1683(-)